MAAAAALATELVAAPHLPLNMNNIKRKRVGGGLPRSYASYSDMRRIGGGAVGPGVCSAGMSGISHTADNVNHFIVQAKNMISQAHEAAAATRNRNSAFSASSHVTMQECLPSAIKQLLHHPNNRRIAFMRTGPFKDRLTFIVDGDIKYEGLTDRLKRAFWKTPLAPESSESKKNRSYVNKQFLSNSAPAALYGCGGSSENKKKSSQDLRKTATGCYYGGKGALHGSKVHRDFQRITQAIYQPLYKKGSRAANVANVDPCALRILISLMGAGIVPIQCEFGVFDPMTRIATPIDCIAWDVRRNQSVMIEVKTGYEFQSDYSEAGSGEPIMNINDCGGAAVGRSGCVLDTPLNRAALQLIIPLLFVKRRYKIDFDYALVVRPISHSQIAQLYRIPDIFKNGYLQKSLYNQLRQVGKSDREKSGDNLLEEPFSAAAKCKDRPLMKERILEKRRLQISIETSPDPSEDVVWIGNRGANNQKSNGAAAAVTKEDKRAKIDGLAAHLGKSLSDSAAANVNAADFTLINNKSSSFIGCNKNIIIKRKGKNRQYNNRFSFMEDLIKAALNNTFKLRINLKRNKSSAAAKTRRQKRSNEKTAIGDGNTAARMQRQRQRFNSCPAAVQRQHQQQTGSIATSASKAAAKETITISESSDSSTKSDDSKKEPSGAVEKSISDQIFDEIIKQCGIQNSG